MDNNTTKKLTITAIGITLATAIFLHPQVIGYAQIPILLKHGGYWRNVGWATK